jgi:hypothetical protein
MVNTKVNGNIPINARINIKYNKDKPTVQFSYPNKKTQMRGSMFLPIQIFFFIVFVLMFCGWYFASNFSMTEYKYGKDSLQKYVECASQNLYQTVTNYSNVRGNLCNKYINDKQVALRQISLPLFLILFLYLLPALIYFPLKKKWNKLYPKWQSLTARKKIAIFKPEDVKENENGIYCELPVFSNVVCDFKCEGEFSNYLKEIDIREHKFVYFAKERIRMGKKKKRVRKVNEFLWYARFYFEKKPEKGKMVVIFK